MLSRSVARPIGCIQNCASRADCDPAGLLTTGPVDPFAVRSNLQQVADPGLVERRDEFVDALAEVSPAVDVRRYHRLDAEQLCGSGRPCSLVGTLAAPANSTAISISPIRSATPLTALIEALSPLR